MLPALAPTRRRAPPPPIARIRRQIHGRGAAILPLVPFPCPRGRGIQARVPLSANRDDDRRGLLNPEGFSVLPTDAPWDDGNLWSIFGAYLLALHVPLSFGGIAAVSKLLHQPMPYPLDEAISAVVLQTVEFVSALSLLRYSAKSQFGLSCMFTDQNIPNRRSWIKASTTGLGFLFVFVLLTSLLADQLIGAKDVNDPILQEIMGSSPSSTAVCFFMYCFTTPLLEELVYRRFLLRTLACKMSWQKAVFVSAIVFSSSHFSVDNAVQLFIIGSVLGSVYCWSGNLISSLVVHSVYNAVILTFTGSS